jgi:hypothetical protein
MSDWASRPLGDAGRRRTFAAVAVVLGASAVALALGVGPQGQREPQRAVAAPGPGPAVIASTATAAAATTVAAPAPPPRPTLADQRSALRAGRAFLRGYLRFEVGDDAAAVRRALQRTATDAFARELLANPPRITGVRPRAGRIDGLELADDATTEDMTVVATIARGDTVTPLTVRFERTEDGWRVGGLG